MLNLKNTETELNQVKRENAALGNAFRMFLQSSYDLCFDVNQKLENKDFDSIQKDLDKFRQWIEYLATSPLIKGKVN